jgi:hypothetical protein
MKHEIIYTDDYALIVVKGKIKEGDWFFNGESVLQVSRITSIIIDTKGLWSEIKSSKKVIAHRPLSDAPILEGVPLLPEFNKKDDVEKKSRDFVKYVGGSQEQRLAFIDGYLEAKETYRFSEDDLRKALLIKHDGLSVDYVIQSLKTKRPKSILLETVGDTETINRCKNFNVEIGCVASKCTCENLSISKTITNSQGQTELVGEYIYG